MDQARYRVGLTRLPLRAAAFVALVCVAILGTGGWREWCTREALLKSAESEMANLARSLTQHAEDSLDLLDSGLVGVVSRLEMDGTDPATIAKLQKVLEARRNAIHRIHGFAIIDERGRWLTSSGAVTSALSDDLFFRHHRQSPDRGAFTGPPVQNIADGEWIITLSRRFNHPDGSFAGVVLGSIDASYLSRFYGQFEVGHLSSLTLMHANGRVIARSPDNAQYVGRDVSSKPLFANPALRVEAGAYRFTSSMDGAEKISFFRRSDRFPLVMLATARKDELLASWRSAALMRMLFMLALALLIAIIGTFLVRQLLRGRHMAVALASKEASFRLLAEGSSDLVTRIGLDDRISYASPSSIRIVGLHPGQLVGKLALAGVNPLDLPAAQATVERLKRGEIEEGRTTCRTQHPEKGEIWLESTLRVTRKENGEIDGAVAISRDVTEQKDLEERLELLATEDGLTGLANRRSFDTRLLEEWSRAHRQRSCLGLLMIDLDHFKAYNDRYGHPAGDECLRAVAKILAAEAQRPTDLAARYGGEEFVMLLPDTDAAGCARIGEKIRRALRAAALRHESNMPSQRVTASIGASACRPSIEPSLEVTVLVEAADRALYAAKGDGRDRLVVADEVATLVPSLAPSRAARGQLREAS
jgi:diguanylate cyclase (GGDEF)-like protein/PAS domain S-box-containing protein